MSGAAYAGKRIAQVVLTIWAIMTLLFVLLHASANPADTLSGPNATSAQIALTTRRLGLDRGWWAQYGTYLWDVLRADYGSSYTQSAPAMRVTLDRLPVSLEIVIPAMVISFVLAMALGTASAFRPRSMAGRTVFYSSFFGQAVPFFWLALVLVLAFAVKTHLFPATGSGGWRFVVLPVAAIAAANTATLARLVRGEVYDVLRRPFVLAVSSKGVTTRRLLWRHVWPNSMPTINSWLAILFAFTIGELVVVEPLFAYAGFGNLLDNAVTANDFPIVEAGVFLVAVLVALASLAADLANRALDPSLRRSVEGL